MNREEAMLKLLALEPERQDRLANITGWGEGETLEVLAALKAQGKVRTITHASVSDSTRLWYVPGSHDEEIQRTQHEREMRRTREARGAAGRKVANNRRKASTGEPRAI